MSHPQPDPDLALAYLEGTRPIEPLMVEARRLRDQEKNRVVTYSRKVFIPLTTLCFDRCSYCTFAKPPGGGGVYLDPEDVMAVARAAESRGCTEALFTLGDRPEQRWAEARLFLEEQGCATTMEYVRRMTELVNAETSLFPHANPGLMSKEDMAGLRASNPSMGLMLENVSPRLMEPGMPHHGCPDKDPARRLEVIEAAGMLRVAFTTGVLVGIGETNRELVDSVFALAGLQRRLGCIQEVIVQNFRAKNDTAMRRHAEPIPVWVARVAAMTRWVMGAEMNVQVPPNLTDHFELYLEAGINDWGGVSPLTIDFVNPERPWPHLENLKARTEAAGFRLLPRLPIYPEFITSEWLAPELVSKVSNSVDDHGYALAPQMEGAFS